jgi:hypothetical protein
LTDEVVMSVREMFAEQLDVAPEYVVMQVYTDEWPVRLEGTCRGICLGFVVMGVC